MSDGMLGEDLLDAAAPTAKSITTAGGKATSFTLDVTERNKCREVAQ